VQSLARRKVCFSSKHRDIFYLVKTLLDFHDVLQFLFHDWSLTFFSPLFFILNLIDERFFFNLYEAYF